MSTENGRAKSQLPKKEDKSPEDLRNQLRSQVLSAQQQRVSLTLFGAQIELVQPSVGDVVTTSSVDARSMVIQLLIKNAYVPGTDVKVFEPTDLDALLNRPFNEEFQKVSRVINDLMGISQREVDEVQGNLKRIQ